MLADVHVPMDEALTRVADGRLRPPVPGVQEQVGRDKVGAFDTGLVQEYVQAFAMNTQVTLHVETLYGSNDHRIPISCFKGLARALRVAFAIDAAPGGRSTVAEAGSAAERFLSPDLEKDNMPVYAVQDRRATATTRPIPQKPLVFVRDKFSMWAFLFAVG